MGEGGNASPHRDKTTGNGRGWADRSAAILVPQHHPKTICICQRSLKVGIWERRGGGVIGFHQTHIRAHLLPSLLQSLVGSHSCNSLLFSLALMVVMISFHTYILHDAMWVRVCFVSDITDPYIGYRKSISEWSIQTPPDSRFAFRKWLPTPVYICITPPLQPHTSHIFAQCVAGSKTHDFLH